MNRVNTHKRIGAVVMFVMAIGISVFVCAQPKGDEGEQERQVKEAEVPAAALATLKKHAGNNTITEFAEEIEHGNKYFEGSWKSPAGHVDVLVTEAGALVEIEEAVSSDVIPKAVMDTVEKAAGKNAKMYFEKKTLVMYEVKYKKGDRRHELVLSPDGRKHEHEDEPSGKGEDDEGEED